MTNETLTKAHHILSQIEKYEKLEMDLGRDLETLRDRKTLATPTSNLLQFTYTKFQTQILEDLCCTKLVDDFIETLIVQIKNKVDALKSEFEKL